MSNPIELKATKAKKRYSLFILKGYHDDGGPIWWCVENAATEEVATQLAEGLHRLGEKHVRLTEVYTRELYNSLKNEEEEKENGL